MRQRNNEAALKHEEQKMKSPSWKPEKLPVSSVDSHTCRQISLGQPCECLAASSIDQFSDWLEIQLVLLLNDNRDWETSQSNRKYFGRGSK
jgi:hypothetical protein